MELSCPAAAALFLETKGRLAFVPGKERETLWVMGNDEPSYLAFLKNSREAVLDYIWREDISWRQMALGVYRYMTNVHGLLVRDRQQEAACVRVEVPKGDCGDKWGFYPIALLDKMLTLDIAHVRLYFRNPALQRQIDRYRKIFGKMTGAEADAFFEEKMEEMTEADALIAGKYRRYFSYYLQQMYLTAYEDYHLLKVFYLGMACCQLLMLLDVTEFVSTGRPPDMERQTKILASLEKRVRHNAGISKIFLERIRAEF